MRGLSNFAAGGANDLVARLTRYGVNPQDAVKKAYAVVYGALQSQAATLAYIDTFWILSVGATVMFLLSFVLKRNDPRAGGGETAAL